MNHIMIRPPVTPLDFLLQSEPRPLFRQAGEHGRWIAKAIHKPVNVMGVLIYERLPGTIVGQKIIFLVPEEAVSILAALMTWEDSLVERCSDDYLIAHAAEIAVCGYTVEEGQQG